MKYFILLIPILLLLGCGETPDAGIEPESRSGPVPIILDTDFGPDYDDVGALAVLHALADKGEAEILATIASTKYPLVGPAIDVVNTYFGRPDLPVGVPRGDAISMGARQHWPDTLAARFPHDLEPGEAAPPAVEVYRRVLSRQPDSSVTIVTVGFLTNLKNLLQSEPDSLSSLSGLELVSQKVDRLVTMGGWFPEGKEFNIERDADASRYIAEYWPTRILFSGYEIGSKIKTGKNLVAERGPENPVREVYRISMAMDPNDAEGRMSWDQTAVLVAVRGVEPYFGSMGGRIEIDSSGYNRWTSGAGPHEHLSWELPADSLVRVIEEMMMYERE